MELIKELKDIVPLLQTLSWIFFISILLIVFRKYIVDILKGLYKRIEKGSSVKAFGVEIGEQKLVTKTSDIKDIKVFGNPDLFQLLCKAETKNMQKSTKAMEVENGALVQVTTEKLNKDGTWTVAEALSFVPNVKVKKNENGNGRYLA